MKFYPLEKLPLHNGFRRCFQLEGVNVTLTQDDGSCYLFESRCPHMDWNLDYADIKQGHITCPKHGIRFNLSTGEGLTPAPIEPLKCYHLVQQGDYIGVDLNAFK